MKPAEYKNLAPLIGERVHIEWRDPKDDWPSFVLMDVDLADGTVQLRGADMPCGTKHEGDVFWADWADIRVMKREAKGS